MYKIADINIQRIHSDKTKLKLPIIKWKFQILNALMSTPFIQKVCLADRGMSYGMSQRRFVESMEDMDKQFIQFRNISYDHTHLHDHTHLPLGQEKFACNDLPSSSIDEAAITRYCKVFENEAATNFCVDSVLHVLTLQQKTNLNSSLLMDATTNIERDLREFDAAFEEFSRSLERKKVSTELSSNSKVDVIITATFSCNKQFSIKIDQN